MDFMDFEFDVDDLESTLMGNSIEIEPQSFPSIEDELVDLDDQLLGLEMELETQNSSSDELADIHELLGLNSMELDQFSNSDDDGSLMVDLEVLLGIISSDQGGFVRSNPASESAIEDLEKLMFDTRVHGSCIQCTVCLENMSSGDQVTRMPSCSHMFHSPCIVQWLRQNRTCPLCRSSLD